MLTSALSSLVAFALLAPATLPQDASDKKQMEKLAFLVGKWEGEGWMSRGPEERMEFKGTETVQMKLGGLALLVEGEFVDKTDGRIVHQTLGVINYRPDRSAFNLRAYLFNRPSADYRLEALSNGYTWSYELEHGATIKYTMNLMNDGTWLERGTYAMEGMDPVPIFEMRLKKSATQ